MGSFQRHRAVIMIFAIWIVVVNVFALIALNRFNLRADTAYNWIPDAYYQDPGLNFNVIHAQWDSFWILDIVEHGYYLRGDDIANVVFFPLYPVMIKIVSYILIDPQFSGWVVSVISLLLAVIFLDKLVQKYFSYTNKEETIIFLLMFPTAYFFNTVYTESLFLFLSIATIYWAKERRWYMVAVCGFCASVTRVTGVLLFLPVLWYLLEDCQYKLRCLLQWRHICIFTIPLGLCTFFLYHYVAFDNALLFFDMQSKWGRSFHINYDHFIVHSSVQMTNFALDLFFVLLACAIAILIWKKIDRGMAIYVIATIAVAVSTGTLMSIGRYIVVLFPIAIYFASIKNPYIKYTLLLISCMLFTLYTILFVNHYWAG